LSLLSLTNGSPRRTLGTPLKCQIVLTITSKRKRATTVISQGATKRPNVLLILADDMGFSDIGSFGGEIPTPNLDALAASGIKLTQFYNTARCSPSRASLLTGLHPHQTGLGELTHDDGPGGYPGGLNDQCATLAEVFRSAGYTTHMAGKWHLTTNHDVVDGSEEVRRSWPTRRGFDRFWGTLAGCCSYFTPTTLHDGESPIGEDKLSEDFFYTDAIAEHAAAAIRETPDDVSLFSYVAFTAPHWPLHARPSDIKHVRGRFDEGWDVLRGRRRERQVADGIVDEPSTLNERDPLVPPWRDEPAKDWQLRRMEVYAAQIFAMDRAIGLIMDALRDSGRADDTIVIFLSDNGGTAEEVSGEPADEGEARARLLTNPRTAPDGSPLRIGNTPDIVPGGADTWGSYGRAWANLSNTPFRLYKRWVHEGGISTPLIVSWPAGNLKNGEIVRTPNQLTDIAPTLFEATGVAPLGARRGVHLPPLPGTSFLSALRGGQSAPHALYWEHIGNAAMRDGKWKIVREFRGDWELYDIDADRSESNDLAAEHPDLTTEMSSRWELWATSVGVQSRESVLEAQRLSEQALNATEGA
jgi:arylsulfatase A-like enzyme